MSSRNVRVLAALTLIVTPVLAAAGQSSVAVSPFVSYIPSATTNPLAGFALTFGGTTGLALRSSAEMSISNPRVDSAAAQAGGIRPWGVDADAMLFLGGLGGGATVFSRALAPYAFAGIGLTGADSAGTNVVRNGWSYGAGAMIPLGLHADVFAEARWRMEEYVLPTSQGAPGSKKSMRFGLSFHVGGGSGDASGGSRRPRRHREIAQRQDDDVQYVVTPAPAPQPVVVVTPQQPAEPEVVYVEQQQRQVPETVIVQREPVVIERDPVVIERAPASTRRVIVNAPRSRTLPGAVTSRQRILTEARTRITSRVYVRDSSGVKSSRVVDRVRGARQRAATAGSTARASQRAQATTQRTRTPVATSRTRRTRTTRTPE